MSTHKINIALADDEPLFRKGIAMLLQSRNDISIAFEASNGEEMVTMLRQSPQLPDIIIVDLKMPVLNGVEATRIIHAEFPMVKIIALTSYHTKSFIANMIDVGAAAYLVKNATPEQLFTTINEVCQTGFYYTEDVLKVIDECLVGPQKKGRSKFNQDHISKREIEILKLICQQYSAAEIADKLYLSIRTVEGHKNNLLRKTECKNMIGLIVYALLHDHVSLDALLEHN
jgi:DNA-binding NarL/FixJ family response regulator